MEILYSRVSIRGSIQQSESSVEKVQTMPWAKAG